MLTLSVIITIISYISFFIRSDIYEHNKSKLNTMLIFSLVSTFNHVSTYLYIPLLLIATISSILYKYKFISKKTITTSLDLCLYISAGYFVPSVMNIFGVGLK